MLPYCSCVVVLQYSYSGGITGVHGDVGQSTRETMSVQQYNSTMWSIPEYSESRAVHDTRRPTNRKDPVVQLYLVQLRVQH